MSLSKVGEAGTSSGVDSQHDAQEFFVKLPPETETFKVEEEQRPLNCGVSLTSLQ
jgi:hypothetical protein